MYRDIQLFCCKTQLCSLFVVSLNEYGIILSYEFSTTSLSLFPFMKSILQSTEESSDFFHQEIEKEIKPKNQRERKLILVKAWRELQCTVCLTFHFEISNSKYLFLPFWHCEQRTQLPQWLHHLRPKLGVQAKVDYRVDADGRLCKRGY